MGTGPGGAGTAAGRAEGHPRYQPAGSASRSGHDPGPVAPAGQSPHLPPGGPRSTFPPAEVAHEAPTLLTHSASLALKLTWALFVPQPGAATRGELQLEGQALRFSPPKGPTGPEPATQAAWGPTGRAGGQHTSSGKPGKGRQGPQRLLRPTTPARGQPTVEAGLAPWGEGASSGWTLETGGYRSWAPPGGSFACGARRILPSLWARVAAWH